MTPAPTPAPSAGHVYVPKLTPRTGAKAAAAPAETSDAQAKSDADDEPEPTTGPVRGFMMEARLAQTLASGGGSHGMIGTDPGAPTIAAIGYRTDRLGVLFGPSFSHYGGDNSVPTTTLGLAFHLEVTVVRTEDRENEGYILAGVSLGNTTLENRGDALAGSVTVGFGARHWVTRHLGLGVELGEGYADLPTVELTGGYNGQIGYNVTRSTSLDTFGALTAAVVF